MLLKLFKRRDSLQKFYQSLPVVSRAYTKKQRYQDFKTVFETPAGRRVLSSIVAQAEGIPINQEDAESHARLAYRAGMRYLGLWIVQTINTEPYEEVDHE